MFFVACLLLLLLLLPLLLLLLSLLLCFLCWHVVEQARGREQKQSQKGGQKAKQLLVKIKGAVMFPNVKIMVFLFLCLLLFVCVVLQNHCKNWGFSQFWATVFWGFSGAKSRANNWATVGSIIGPHVGSCLCGTCGPIIDPRLLL